MTSTQTWTAAMPDDTVGQTAFINARLLDPATDLDTSGGLLTDGEEIADFGPQITADSVPDGITIVDCGGHCLAPGLVDIRVQIREPGEEHKGTLESAGRAGTAGGVTSIVCLPDTDPIIEDMSVVEFVARRARKIGLSKVYPYGAITKGFGGKELTELGILAEAGAVAFTDSNKAVADATVMRRVLSYAATFDLLIVQHPEEPSLAAGAAMNEGEVATRLGLPGVPTAAETILIERDLRLLELSGGKLHFAHISTGDAVDVIRKAKARGLNVTCDTAAPYFSLNETSVGEYRTFAKLSPPLRSEADREAIVEGIVDGTIDAICSDHLPHDEDSKRLPFAQAAFGGVGLETLLPVSLELYHNGFLSLNQLLAKITVRPAELMGLPAGRLKKGAAADLTLFDLTQGWKIRADELSSKAKNSPFDGRLVQGVVLRTVIDGRTVYTLDN
ncbi:MAG: dihydroorotase [Proteobacteria bacterium]|nr:dihydroorotase [Pseudomonadota bacterium]